MIIISKLILGGVEFPSGALAQLSKETVARDKRVKLMDKKNIPLSTVIHNLQLMCCFFEATIRTIEFPRRGTLREKIGSDRLTRNILFVFTVKKKKSSERQSVAKKKKKKKNPSTLFSPFGCLGRDILSTFLHSSLSLLPTRACYSYVRQQLSIPMLNEKCIMWKTCHNVSLEAGRYFFTVLPVSETELGDKMTCSKSMLTDIA